MSVHSFPLGAEAPTVDIGFIRRALGKQRMAEPTFIALVQALVDQRGFPRPYPDFRKGTLVDRVTRRSTFARCAVDAWLDNHLPPEAGLALQEAARANAAADMDSAARNLRLIRGGRA